MSLRTSISIALILASALGIAAQSNSVAVANQTDFQISGVLVDANTGQPIQRARVAIAPVTQRDNFTTVITHEDGRFLFPNLAPGKYTLTAQARGYLLQSFNQHDQYSSSIVVGSDLDSSNLEFRLAPESMISGVVTDEGGEGVRRAQVILYQIGLSAGVDATRVRGRTMTDDEGAYRFWRLLPGHYLVAVEARPWYAQNQPTAQLKPGANGNDLEIVYAGPQLDVAYPITFFPGVTDAAGATPIVLGRGEKFAADVNLQPVPAAHFRLSRGKSDPEHPTRVTLEKRVLDGPPLQIGVNIINNTGQNEQEIAALPPGHYTMKTSPEGPGARNEAAVTREVDIGANGEIENSQSSGYVPVTAKVQFEGGTPSGRVSLQLLNKKSREAFNQGAGSDGEIVFDQGLRAGSYEVSIFTTSAWYLKSLSATGATVAGRTIEIRPGNPVSLSITAASGQGLVTGTALRQGKPFAGAMVVLVPADPVHNQVLFRRDQSDSDGTFTLANVVPGTYTLLAIENGWDLEWMKPSVLKKYIGAGATVQVQNNGKYDIKAPVQ